VSVKVMTAVFDLSNSSANGDRLVLLALADHADDETWCCWPSVGRIAKKANLCERAVQDSLKRLMELGEVCIHERKGGRGHTAKYCVLLGKDKGCSICTLSADAEGGKGAGCDRERVQVATLKGADYDKNRPPILSEPSVEPSPEPSGRAKEEVRAKPTPGKRLMDEGSFRVFWGKLATKWKLGVARADAKRVAANQITAGQLSFLQDLELKVLDPEAHRAGIAQTVEDWAAQGGRTLKDAMTAYLDEAKQAQRVPRAGARENVAKKAMDDKWLTAMMDLVDSRKPR
jgi:hypothetical protein